MPLISTLPIDAFEHATSREATWTVEGASKDQTREYTVTGYVTPEEALNYALNLPAGSEGHIPTYIPYNVSTNNPAMVLRSVTAKAGDTNDIWIFSVEYKSLLRDDQGNDINYTFSGTTSGASQNITQGYQYTKYGTGPDYQGAINVNANGVDGVDIVIPKLEFQIDKVLPRGTLWFAYLFTITKMTGSINQAPFGPFARGEVLYLGADFAVRGAGEVSFTHKFVASPNRSAANNNALTIGSINGIEKLGHDYLWIDYVAAENSGFVIRQPRTVHVHRVYEFADFNQLQI